VERDEQHYQQVASLNTKVGNACTISAELGRWACLTVGQAWSPGVLLASEACVHNFDRPGRQLLEVLVRMACPAAWFVMIHGP